MLLVAKTSRKPSWFNILSSIFYVPADYLDDVTVSYQIVLDTLNFDAMYVDIYMKWMVYDDS